MNDEIVFSFVSLCMCVSAVSFFFIKQKTAYEMRMSDGSSDVCSADLLVVGMGGVPLRERGLVGRRDRQSHHVRVEALAAGAQQEVERQLLLLADRKSVA